MGVTAWTAGERGTGPSVTADYFALAPCDEYRLPGGALLLRSRSGAGQAVVSVEVAILLGRCDRFRTRAGHIEALVNRAPELRGREDYVAGVLDAVIAQGLFVSGDEWLQQLVPPLAPTLAPAPLAVVITCDRPRALRRLLGSIAANCRPGSACRLLVIDDSRHGGNQRDNQALVTEFGGLLPFPLDYFGPHEQRDLLEAIVRRVPHGGAALDFLAGDKRWRDHPSFGRSRNLALLLSTGRRLLLLDDDILCAAYRPTFAEPGLNFRRSPRQSDFILAADRWLEDIPAMDGVDPLALHGDCLGLPLAGAIAATGTGLAPDVLRETPVDDILAIDPLAPVLTTACGSLGDPGAGSNGWLLELGPDSIARLTADPAKLASALTDRRAWSARHQLTVQARFAMSQITGLDNRQLLPPFMPAFRGEDGLYGAMLSHLYPGSSCLDLPWAIPHLPMPERRWATSGLAAGVGISVPFNAWRGLFGDEVHCRSKNMEIRLGWIAGLCEQLAAVPDDSLAQGLRRDWLGSVVSRLARIGELRRQASLADWKKVLDDAAQVLQRQLAAGPAAQEIQGQPVGLAWPELYRFWRGTWQEFGASLSHWPALRTAAAEVTGGRYE